MKTIRIGAGAGYSGDRIEPALELAEQGRLQYLVFECLAERTIALAQQERLRDPARGFDPLLVERFEAVLPACIRNRVRIVTNMGAANPDGCGRGGRPDRAQARRAADDRRRRRETTCATRSWRPTPGSTRWATTVSACGKAIVSANAYLGADAHRGGARRRRRRRDHRTDGRSVPLPGADDPRVRVGVRRLAAARARDRRRTPPRVRRPGDGRLLRRPRHSRTCPTWRGSAFRSPRWARTAGRCSRRSKDRAAASPPPPARSSCSTSCTARPVPDARRDRRLQRRALHASVGPDRIAVRGASGAARPEHAEGVGRLLRRLHRRGADLVRRTGLRGPRAAGDRDRARPAWRCAASSPRRSASTASASTRSSAASRPAGAEPAEVRVRVAARCRTAEMAAAIANEVETLYTNGPAAGGGVDEGREAGARDGLDEPARDRSSSRRCAAWRWPP